VFQNRPRGLSKTAFIGALLIELADGTRKAADILGRSPAFFKRWRHQEIGPDGIELE
jgi:hypothetical protein